MKTDNRRLWLAVAAFVAFAGYLSTAAAQVTVGTAQTYGVIGGSALTNTGPSVINGDMGLSPGSSVTGFPPGLVNGTTNIANAAAVTAQNDVTTAYDFLASQPCSSDLTGTNLGGLTLTPGIYCFSTSAQLTGTLTLDAQGNANSVFIFRIGSTLTTAVGSSVALINSADACNVWWQVGSSATLGTTTAFQGSILALTSITLNTDVTMTGRTLARNGAVTLDSNTIDVPACAAPPPCPIITLSPTTLPAGIVGVDYSSTVAASGTTSTPVIYSITGSLPPGLMLNSATGAITGSPTTAGVFGFTVSVTDTAICSGSRAYSITITAGGPAQSIPTLTQWGMILLAGLVALFGFGGMRQRRK